jgi:excisionase family DNA binding protein
MSALITKKQALELLKIGKTKFYSELNERRLKAVNIGRRTYLKQAEIDQYIASLPAYEPKSVTSLRKKRAARRGDGEASA